MSAINIFCIANIDEQSFFHGNPVSLWYNSLYREFTPEQYVLTITYKSYPSFPNGPLLVKAEKCDFCSAIQISYINIKWLRYMHIAVSSFLLILLKKLQHRRLFLKVFVWNLNSPFALASFLKLMPCTIFNIILADGPSISKYVYPSRVYYLSWKAYCHSSYAKKIFLPMPPINPPSLPLMNVSNCIYNNNDCFTICFSGSLNHWSGLLPFLEPLLNVRPVRIRFVITSPDSPPSCYSEILRHPSIDFLGDLSPYRLHCLHRQVDAFIVTRNLDAIDAENSYPSKIARYLFYDKPIFSVRNSAYPPSHFKILLLIDSVLELINIVESPGFEQLARAKLKAIERYKANVTWPKVASIFA